jgi:hypothetical protein
MIKKELYVWVARDSSKHGTYIIHSIISVVFQDLLVFVH